MFLSILYSVYYYYYYYYYYYLLSPLCRVFKITYLTQTMFLGYVVAPPPKKIMMQHTCLLVLLTAVTLPGSLRWWLFYLELHNATVQVYRESCHFSPFSSNASMPDLIALYVTWCSCGGNQFICTFAFESLRFLPMTCSSFDVSPLTLSKMSFGYFLKGANTRTASICIFILHFLFSIWMWCYFLLTTNSFFFFLFHFPENPVLVDLFGYWLLYVYLIYCVLA